MGIGIGLGLFFQWLKIHTTVSGVQMVHHFSNQTFFIEHTCTYSNHLNTASEPDSSEYRTF